MNQVNWVFMVQVMVYWNVLYLQIIFRTTIWRKHWKCGICWKNSMKTMVSVNPQFLECVNTYLPEGSLKICSYHCIFFIIIPESATNIWECWIVVCHHLHGLCQTKKQALWQ
jgi:hypothetical protein